MQKVTLPEDELYQKKNRITKPQYFKKGESGNPKGKPKGAVSAKTKGWELLKETITTGLTDKFLEEMEGLQGTAYINAYLNVLEFFRPRLSRTESLNQNVNQDQVVISVTNTATLTMFPDNFTEDTEDLNSESPHGEQS